MRIMLELIVAAAVIILLWVAMMVLITLVPRSGAQAVPPPEVWAPEVAVHESGAVIIIYPTP